MWTRDYSQTGSRIALLIGQLVIILLCIGYINYTYFVNIYPDKMVKENFDQINCSIVSKRLTTKGHLIHEYRADFYLSYRVNNAQYGKWVSANGLDYSFSHDKEGEQSSLDQYQEGGTYPCWYNPDDPSQVVLALRHSWTSTFPLMLPSAIAILMLYYFIKGLSQLLGAQRAKAKEKKL